MNAAYDDVLKRLKEERKRLKLTQREMSGCARISQANYNKVEAGLRRLSYYEVKCLCDSNVDVHYVFTGLKGRADFCEFFLKYSYQELMRLLNILTSVAEMHDDDGVVSRWRRLLWHAELFRTVGEDAHSDSGMFLSLRRFLGCNQREMAEKLGVDVKKLRELENGRCLPDSELLCRLYVVFGVCPAVVLKDKSCLASEISCFLEDYDFEAADGVFQIFRSLQELPEAL